MTKLRRASIFCTALLTFILALPGGMAMAHVIHAQQPVTPKLIPNGRWEYRAGYEHFEGDFSGDWVHCLYVTKQRSTLSYSCTKTVTISESISGNIGFPIKEISASVGFNVTYSAGVSVAGSVRVKAGGSGWLDDGFRYSRYVVGMEKRWCVQTLILSCNGWSGPHPVTVQHHLGNTFYYFGTGAE